MTSSEAPTIDTWFPIQQESPDLSEKALPKFEGLQDISSRVVEPSSPYTFSKLTHDADLSDLWDYYETQISQGRMRRDKIAAKECSQRCRHISFVYPASVIYRHPHQVGFGLRLMQLGYRYCKDCNILIPKSIILELEEIRMLKREKRLRKIRTEATPIKCPCCAMKTALAQVLIRKTKMGRKLFRDEGY